MSTFAEQCDKRFTDIEGSVTKVQKSVTKAAKVADEAAAASSTNQTEIGQLRERLTKLEEAAKTAQAPCKEQVGALAAAAVPEALTQQGMPNREEMQKASQELAQARAATERARKPPHNLKTSSQPPQLWAAWGGIFPRQRRSSGQRMCSTEPM